ncbi:MAG: hypothetical protein F6K42_05955, partial [Leptolyngbya sp. SIO1D8]|nr:hypothetical protein [Leptolyngbya sp. SIO1D8]
MASFARVFLRQRIKMLLLAGILLTLHLPAPARAQSAPLDEYCQVSQTEASRKEDLRRAAFAGD